MTGPLFGLQEKLSSLDHLFSQTMNSIVQVMHIIMDTVQIFLMKDIKNLKSTAGFHVLKNTHELW